VGVVVQVKAGTIFNNILVTDDLDYALKFAEDTLGRHEGCKCIPDASPLPLLPAVA